MLNLLAQTIEQSQAAAEAAISSIREIKRNWNIQRSNPPKLSIPRRESGVLLSYEKATDN